MLDLARVAKLHEAAIAAGLPGVLADAHHIEKGGLGTIMLINSWGDDVGPTVSQAACAWWVKDWCEKHDPDEAAIGTRFMPHIGTADYYLAWAEMIVAARKAP